MSIRFVQSKDVKQILHIYGEYMETPVTFEYHLPSEREFAGRIHTISGEYPYLVWEEENHLQGYAYACRFKERAAYQWDAELSVYLLHSATSRGIGRRLYTALIEILKLQGIKNVYGFVTMPNEKSENLHKSMGFRTAGVFENTGYKCGKWLDVACFEKKIGSLDENPGDIFSVSQIPDHKIEKILRSAQF